MDNLTIGLICFGAFLFFYMVYGLLLPRKWEVKESILVPGELEPLFDYLNRLPNWEEWTNWNKESKHGFRFKYEGPESGKGAKQLWSAKKRKGSTEITGGERPQRIDYQFSFGRGQQKMDGSLGLTEEAGEVRVEWSMRGDAGDNPSSKIMAKMMRPYMSKDFRAGLERLQRMVKEGTAGQVSETEDRN